MKTKDIMTHHPICCLPETSLQTVARLMLENNCGAIPIVENKASLKLIGIITDRDITCRAVANGYDLQKSRAGEFMSSPVATVTPETDLESCCSIMEEHQVRRIPVVDEKGSCCGIVTQAQIARKAPESLTGELVREVSKPEKSRSRL